MSLTGAVPSAILWETWSTKQPRHEQRNQIYFYIQGASVNQTILQHCYFWFGNTGADAPIAILLPTLKRFSCNGAVEWSTTCFCCESVFQKRWQFCDRSVWISNRLWDSSQSCCFISPCHQDLGSKLRGLTLKKKGGSVKTVHTPENIARVTQSGNAQNGVDFFQWPLSLPQYSRVYALFLHYHLSSLLSNLEVSNPGLDGMGWWNSTIAMNPELYSTYKLSDHKTVTVFGKRFHRKSTLCFITRLHCN